MTYHEYILSPEWDELRRRCYKRAGHRCENCHAAVRLDAHHTIYRDPVESGVVEDLIALCRDCHKCWHRWFDSQQMPSRIFSRGETLSVLAKIRRPIPLSRKQKNKQATKRKKHRAKISQGSKGISPFKDIYFSCRNIEARRAKEKKRIEAEILQRNIARHSS